MPFPMGYSALILWIVAMSLSGKNVSFQNSTEKNKARPLLFVFRERLNFNLFLLHLSRIFLYLSLSPYDVCELYGED